MVQPRNWVIIPPRALAESPGERVKAAGVVFAAARGRTDSPTPIPGISLNRKFFQKF